MKKLEPGMLCRVVGSHVPENQGKLVTLVRFIGRIKDEYVNGLIVTTARSDWWETDTMLPSSNPRIPPDPFMPGYMLQPINPDRQPADEEWQADFKRLLSGKKQTVKSGG